MANCKVIAVTNQKGGVGKTTTTANLGIGLAQQNKRVLLIDADAQGSLTLSLGYPKPDELPITLADIMQNVIDDTPIPDGCGILHHGEGVDLLPANIELSGMEIRLINAMSRESVLRTYINAVKPHYDYILIDCMPSLGMMPINSLAAADSVIIPSQPSYLSAKGLDLLMQSIAKVKRQINPKLKIDGILFTMVDSRTNEAKEIIASLRISAAAALQFPAAIRTMKEQRRFAHMKNTRIIAVLVLLVLSLSGCANTDRSEVSAPSLQETVMAEPAQSTVPQESMSMPGRRSRSPKPPPTSATSGRKPPFLWIRSWSRTSASASA